MNTKFTGNIDKNNDRNDHAKKKKSLDEYIFESIDDSDTFDDDLYSVEGDLYESYNGQIPTANPVTGEPCIEILVVQTINRAFSASEYLKGILLRMRLSGRIAVTVRHGSVHLEISGAEPGLVIGHRGQNLDALQHLVNRMVNKDSEDLVPVTVDADNYRGRRLQQLEKLVRSLSREVIDTGKTIITDPMTPSERRLFHMSANKVRGIRTTSFGNGFFQPVKIYPAHLSGHSFYMSSKDSSPDNFSGSVHEYGDTGK